MLHLAPAHGESIRRHGAADYPAECCGVLLGAVVSGVKVVREVLPLANVHPDDPARHFALDPAALKALQGEEVRTGRRILGFYHSHPDGPPQPSATDAEWAWEWYSYVIVSMVGGIPAEMTCWQFDAARQTFDAEDWQTTI